MSNSNIQVGDEVSWNWGGGHPTGKVAEIKTSGQLEIESKGKRVHKNADEQNPAVHVERSGNDVVKRASELNRLRGGGEGAEGETVAQGGGEGEGAAGEGATQGGSAIGETAVQEGGEGGGSTTAVEAEAGAAVEVEERPADEKPKRGRRGTGRGKRTSAETRKKQSEAGKKGAAARKAKAGERGRRKAAEEAAVGEKREAGAEDSDEVEKEAKKPKTQ